MGYRTGRVESGWGDGGYLLSGRVVPDGVEGNVVYGRSLRHGEEDTGQEVDVPPGYEFAMRPGALAVHVTQIDAHSPARAGGYAPIANTVWTWYQFGEHEQRFLHFMFSFARRLDAAHSAWAEAMHDRERAQDLLGIEARVGNIAALATAEVAVVALHRAIRMAHSLVESHRPDLDLPAAVQSVLDPLKQIRDALEHIDERADGRSGQAGQLDPDAWTIFDQPGFVPHAVLTYKGHELAFDHDVLAALLSCRDLIMEAMSNAESDVGG